MADLGGYVHALDSTSGLREIWSIQVADRGIRAGPLVYDQRVIVASRDGKVYWLDSFDGELINAREIEGAPELLGNLLLLEPSETLDIDEPLVIVSSVDPGRLGIRVWSRWAPNLGISSIDHRQEPIGMWDIILNPFVTILTWLYALLNQDIVLAIIVLTVIIRFLTYPLLAKQQESSRKMQQVQPQLKKLQEKYKNDKEKLIAGTDATVSGKQGQPVGGCFPLVIQFPILIGLYQAIFFALAATPFQLVDFQSVC